MECKNKFTCPVCNKKVEKLYTYYNDKKRKSCMQCIDGWELMNGSWKEK